MLKENNKVRKISNNQSTCIVCNLCLGTYVVGAKIPFSDKKKPIYHRPTFSGKYLSIKIKEVLQENRKPNMHLVY